MDRDDDGDDDGDDGSGSGIESKHGAKHRRRHTHRRTLSSLSSMAEDVSAFGSADLKNLGAAGAKARRATFRGGRGRDGNGGGGGGAGLLSQQKWFKDVVEVARVMEALSGMVRYRSCTIPTPFH